MPEVGARFFLLRREEEKAKTVAAVWRTKLIQFLAALAVSHQDDFEE